jgi:DNA-binding MarR family transcriptional regulator
MTVDRQWLNLGLDALPPDRAQRVRLFRLLLGTAGRLRAELDRELAASGITTQQGQPEPPTLGVVAQALGMTHQNVKQIALALQRKGFLDIVVDETDRRARRLVLTDHHHRFWDQRNPQDFALVEAMSRALTDTEVRTLVRLLGKVLKDRLA